MADSICNEQISPVFRPFFFVFLFFLLTRLHFNAMASLKREQGRKAKYCSANSASLGKDVST